jgi:enoyl-CoA hydratase/carnithine racemase
MAYETILVETRAAAAWLTLNRPQKRNAIDSACLRELRDALARAREDAAVRAIVIRGAGGRAFSAGADIGEMAALADGGRDRLAAYMELWLGLLTDIETLPKPVLASVQGYALAGGTELALACDFVLCAEDARFGLTEIAIGVIPGAGAGVRLTRAMGRSKAKEILMLGDLVSGPEAVACGLANRCVSQDALAAETEDWVARLAARPPLALAAAKACVNEGAEAPLDRALAFELEAFLALFGSEDQKEGMRAFLEKRAPVFRGR